MNELILDQIAAIAPHTKAYLLVHDQVYPPDTPKKIITALHAAQEHGQTQLNGTTLSTPIHLNGRLVGVLQLVGNTPFDAPHQKAALAFAQQISLELAAQEAAQVMQLMNEIAQLATSDQQWEAVLAGLAGLLAALYQAHACVITLLDRQTKVPQRIATWDKNQAAAPALPITPPQGLTQLIVKELQPVFIDDASQLSNPPTHLIQEFKAKSLVGLPLVARGQALGAVFLMRTERPDPFLPARIATLSASLNQIALAIANQLLLDETRHRLYASHALLEIAALAAAATDLDALLQQVLEFCRQAFGVQAGAMLVYRQGVLVYDARNGFGWQIEEDERHIAVQGQTHLLAAALREVQPKFANSASKAAPTLQYLDASYDNMLVSPLRVHDADLGVLVLAGKGGDFTFNDAGLLMAIGSHLAAALRNADLLDSTRARLNETEILQRIAAITSGNMEIDTMLSAAIEEAAKMFTADGMQVLVLDDTGRRLNPHFPSTYGVMQDWAHQSYDANGDSPFAQVLHHDAPQMGMIEDYHRLSVPLKTQQGSLGVLSAVSRQPFSDAHSRLAMAMGSQIAVGMQSIRLYASEHHRADMMLLINQITQELSATLDLRGLMKKVVSNVHDTLGYDTVYLFLMDDEQKSLVCQAAATGIKNGLEVGFALPLGKGLVGKAVHAKEVMMVADVRTHPDYHLYDRHEAIRSALIVPLQHGGSQFGAIELLSRQEHAFGESDVMAMENLASQVSIAMDNARLYNQAQRRLLEQGIVHQIGQDLTAILEYDELVHAVARHMTRALDTSGCSVAIYDPLRDRIRIEANYRLPGTEQSEETLMVGASYQLSKLHASREAIQKRRAVTTYVDDPDSPPKQVSQLQLSNALGELIIPMAIGERIIGVVRWSENRRQRRFSREDERLAQTLISQAAIAIENARLFQEAERSAREQAMLSDVTLSLTAVNTLEDLVERFTQHVHDALQAENTIVSLLNDDDAWLIKGHILTTCQLSETALGLIPTRENDTRQIRQALQAGESVFTSLDTMSQTTSQLELALLIQRGAAVALVPIFYRGKLMGVAEVSAENPNAFSLESVLLLEAMANTAAIAIDNVRLYEREQRRLRKMERIQVSARLISSELDKHKLLDVVVKEAAVIFEIQAVAVLMPDPFDLHYVVHTAYGLSDRFVKERRIPISLSSATVEAMSEEERHRPAVYLELAPAIVNDAQKQLIEAEGIHSAMSVPLVKGGKLLGRFELYSKDSPRRFSDDSVEIAQVFASQIAVAFDNADLYLAAQQRAIELAEANRLRSQFLANISHELRTPMNSILGFSDTILSGLYGDLNDAQRSRLERIQRNGKNLLALIDDLLDISKIDAGHMEMALEKVNVLDELQQIIQSFESQTEAKGIYLQLVVPEAAPFIRGDALRLRQVFVNLMGNAVKFTKEGGVTVTVESKREVRLSPNSEEDPYQEVTWISFTDTGIGISLEDQLIIFDEFRQVDGSATREYGGTGLGLAICKRLIELMGGRIWVDSEVGAGSTFTVVVPNA